MWGTSPDADVSFSMFSRPAPLRVRGDMVPYCASPVDCAMLPARVLCHTTFAPGSLPHPLSASVLCLRRFAARDAQAGQSGNNIDYGKHHKAILEGNSKGFQGEIAAQRRLDFGLEEFSHVATALEEPG